ncbi:DUF349 domain-containing protein [Aliiglaciecola sp. LCG003]|uniref:DUF349 domain-containing protein n=1 Tax=Aliiglaciecola sp. LCG003 TaxID=3053655 RepID=UPI002573F282|nr:DUF349 domain-containing protein [Aliiglaciecola sp. LCG003]WJG07843.1 DUF349 domain-containing protein [Aliiglaciecola sp. LCG003]
MIFKKLFRPKYQDPNPQVRIAAIGSLSPEEQQHKSQLHELAFNDEDPNVNLAALKRLNNFALWCKMAQTGKSERVRKKAQSMVEDALFAQGELDISAKERHQFILECKSISLLEKLLALPSLQTEHADLLLGMLKKIDKPHVTRQIFLSTANEQIQLALLAEIDDQSTLLKCAKRSELSSVKQAIESKVEQLAQSKAKPKELEKNARMILSQLLALKDKTDLLFVQRQKDNLSKAYQQAQLEFDCLKADVRTNLEERFAEISNKVDAVIALLEPQWRASIIASQLESNLDSIQLRIEALLSNINLELCKDINKVTMGEVEGYEHQLQALQAELQLLSDKVNQAETQNYAIPQVHRNIEQLFNRINQSKATLGRLPEFQKSVEVADEFLTKFANLPLPTDLSQLDASKAYLHEQTLTWKEYIASYQSNWPQNLQQQWKAVRTNWQAAITVLSEQVKQNENRVKGKLRAVDSLVNQGKFKAAMGLFERVRQWYAELPEKQQAILQRSFDSTKEQIENLKDWQQYIAEPRKPAILAEVEAIILTPLEIKQQSAAVKRLRSEWNSLGNLQTDEDSALNKEFEILIEKAFEPCRDYFVQQEQERAKNLVDKQAIISSLNDLQHQSLAGNELVSRLTPLQNGWRNIGKVDYQLTTQLKQQYEQALAPLKQRVKQFYQDNQQQKESLIAQAKALLDNEDVMAAVEQAKLLQQKWKSIASAGHKRENTLWANFRDVNDQLFAKRQLAFDSSKEQLNQQTQALDEQLQQLSQDLTSAAGLSELDEADSAIAQVNQLAADLPDSASRSYRNKIRHLTEQVEKKRQKVLTNKDTQVMNQLFDVLEKSATQPEIQSLLQGLPNQWQQHFNAKQAPDSSRQDLTILMDILADVPSPDSERDRRKTLQLQVMTDKLQHGDALDKHELLCLWVQHGKLDADELPLLERVKAQYN